jgi:hypothetical protein
MNPISILSKPVAHVFGHLYVAVFSNGTVKAGMAKHNPQDRVTSHAHSGKAFGIALETAFYASVYTNDTRARERLMHQEIGALATLTAGREWFKFEDVNAALNFASAYCRQVERMSFSERPSPEEIKRREKEISDVWDLRLFKQQALVVVAPTPEITFFSPPSADVLRQIDAISTTYTLDLVAIIARKIMDHEDYLAMADDDCDSGLPVLVDAMNQHWDAALAPLTDPNDFVGRGEAMSRMSLESALSIIKAAANYPNFFSEAVSRREVAS